MPTLKFKPGSVKAALGAVTTMQQAVARAYRNSGDKAARSLATAEVKAVRKRKRLKAAFARAAIRVVRPPQGSILDAMTWKIVARDKPVALTQYPYRQTAKGVVARVNVGSSTLIPHAFVARMRTGHVGVFVRKGPARFPIKELYSSRITDVLQDSGLADRLLAEAKRLHAEAFAVQLGVQIGKLK